MLSGALKINGTDVYSLGLHVEQVDGIDPWPQRDVAFLDTIADREAAVIANSRRVTNRRTVRVVGQLDCRGIDVATRLAALAALAERDLVELEFPARRGEGVMLRGILDGPRGAAVPPPAFGNGRFVQVDWQFVCPNPFWTERAPTRVTGIAGERVACPSGTGPSTTYIVVVGPATSPITITHRDGAGNILSTIVAALALTDTGESLHLYGHDGGEVWEEDDGAEVAGAAATLTAGYKFPVLRDEYARGGDQTIETDKGSVIIEYQQAHR